MVKAGWIYGILIYVPLHGTPCKGTGTLLGSGRLIYLLFTALQVAVQVHHTFLGTGRLIILYTTLQVRVQVHMYIV